jgi:hypothetical protein
MSLKKYRDEVLALFTELLQRYPEVLNEDLLGTVPRDDDLIEFLRSQIAERDAIRDRIGTYQVHVHVVSIAPVSNREDRHRSPIGRYTYVVNALDERSAEDIALTVFNQTVSIGTQDDFLIDVEIEKIESRMPVS